VADIRVNSRAKNADKRAGIVIVVITCEETLVSRFPTYLVQSFRMFYTLDPRSSYSSMALCTGRMAVLSTFLPGRQQLGF
jgi:hypothetical protein